MSSLNSFIEQLIKEAINRGEFDNLPGKGQPVDLTEYFNTPESLRAGYKMLKDAGFVPEEIELKKEIEALKEKFRASQDDQIKARLHKAIEEKTLRFNIMMERRNRRQNNIP